MGRLSGGAALPTWTLSDGKEYLLERGRRLLLEEVTTEVAPSRESEEEKEEECPCWWILSALDRCDGKEAREAYYEGL